LITKVILYCHSSCYCYWGNALQKNPKSPIISDWIGMEFVRSRNFDLTSHFQDGDCHDAISHRKVLSVIWSVHMQHLPGTCCIRSLLCCASCGWPLAVTSTVPDP